MQRSHRTWSRTLVRRGIVVVLAAIGIALYGLATTSGPSLGLKPAAAFNFGASSQPSVGLAISPTNGSVNVAARGPNNSLMFYWNVAGTWHGPLGLGGANTTYSAPSIIAEANGNFDIAVEGPGHTIYFYWDASGTWYGPLGVGAAGSTYSTPSMAIDNNANLILTAQGPTNGLYAYWNVSGTWYGPLGIGGNNTAFSAPSVTVDTCGGSCNEVSVYADGPNNDMRQWAESTTNPWSGPQEYSNDGTAFSTAASYEDTAVYQAPNHALEWTFGFYHQVQIATAGNVYSAPSFTSGGSGNDRITAQGPGHSLYFWFGSNSGGGNGFHGPAQVSGAGTTYSAPAMAEDPNTQTNLDLAVQGPSNTLWFYWNLGGPWYGPYQVAGPGSTFGSSN